MTLEGRTALVTGGGRGIGKAIAERLARDGARVVVAGRTVADLEAVAASTKGVAIPMDVGDRASLRAAIARIQAEVGRIDVLVNNAGIASSAPLAKTTDEIWDSILAVNATAAFVLCRALLPGMVEGGFGRVIGVASNAGRAGYAYSSAYCASKHALVGLTRALAVEFARTPVTINCVCPGWTDTNMVEDAVARIAGKTGRDPAAAREALASMSPQKRIIQPAEVAHLVASLCAPEAAGIHGQSIVLDGGQVMA